MDRNSESQSLGDLLLLAWRGRVCVLAGMVAGSIIAVLLMLVLVPHYEAQMIIAPPAQSADERSLTILNANPSALPVMSVSSRISRDYTKFQQTFREFSAATILLKYQGVLNKTLEDRIFTFSPKADIKTADEFSSYIKAHVSVDPVGATSSLILTYKHPDPEFAVKFLQHLHKITDEMIRNDARSQTEARMAYLQKALREAYNPDNRKALADQLMVEEHQRMLISMGEPFSAELIEPPSASTHPVWPKGCVIYPFCILIGAFFGFLFFVSRRSR